MEVELNIKQYQKLGGVWLSLYRERVGVGRWR